MKTFEESNNSIGECNTIPRAYRMDNVALTHRIAQINTD